MLGEAPKQEQEEQVSILTQSVELDGVNFLLLRTTQSIITLIKGDLIYSVIMEWSLLRYICFG
jgi:hypothetical protein